MRKFIIGLSIIFIIPVAVYAGLSFGLIKAAKKTADKVDAKVIVRKSALLDTQSPTTPTNLTAVAASSSQINLSWIASTDNIGVTGYRIYRNAGVIPIATPTGTTYNNTGLTASTDYSYTVTACDAAGNCSAQSTSASASTDIQAPTVPAGLTAVAASSSQINLSWSASTDNVGVTTYKIYRDGGIAPIATPTGTTYNDISLSGATAYAYTVSACDAAGNCSAQSTVVSATTPGTAVGGIISVNTTWTLANSPYILTSVVQLAYGATLTIQPGVVIQGGVIKVFGTMNAIGNNSSRIFFDNVFIRPEGISTQFHSINIQFADINAEYFYYNGNAAYGNLTLKDSKLQNIPGGQNIYLWYPTSDCYIERNIFINSGGISVGTSNNIKVYVRNNVFFQQATEYSGAFGPQTYAIKNWASYDTSETIVAYNSFLSTDRVALLLPVGYTNAKITAINNYWNTTNASEIDSMIFDKNDSLSSASYITYTPFLTSPDPSTPALP